MKHQLRVVGGPVVARSGEGVHHCGHAAYDEVLPHAAHHGRVHRLRHGFEPFVVVPERIERPIVIAERPEELLEVEGTHRNLPLVPYGQGWCVLELAVPHPQERTRAYDVAAPVLCEVLERGSCLRALLQLVEKEEGLAGDDVHARHEERDARVEVLRRQRPTEDLPVVGVLDEVELDETLVLRLPEAFDDERLADLASAVDEEALGAV